MAPKANALGDYLRARREQVQPEDVGLVAGASTRAGVASRGTGELAVYGIWDLLRIDHVRNIIEHLGYPAYLLTIVGVWKVPGAVALLVRRYPRLQ